MSFSEDQRRLRGATDQSWLQPPATAQDAAARNPASPGAACGAAGETSPSVQTPALEMALGLLAEEARAFLVELRGLVREARATLAEQRAQCQRD